MNDEILKLLADEPTPSKVKPGVCIRLLSEDEYAEFANRFSDDDAEGDKPRSSRMFATLLVAVLVKADGMPLFQESEVEDLASCKRISGRTLRALFREAQDLQLAALREVSFEKKESAGGADSTASSPEASASASAG